MLKQVSRFVLVVLPYVLSALIAVIVVPGFLYSQLYGKEAAGAASSPGRANLELVRQNHATFGAGTMFLGKNDSEKHVN